MSKFQEAAEQVDLEERIAHLETTLSRTRQALHDERKKSTALVEAVYQGAHDARLAIGEYKPTKAPARDKRTRGEHVALWDLGDWQNSKVTETYNHEVLEHRLGIFLAKAEYFLEEQRSSRPVRHCEVVFGGDMIEGWWNFPLQPLTVDMEPIDQVVHTADQMVRVVRRALELHDTVHVTPEPGNHGRIGGKKDTVKRETNFDRMAYILAMRELRPEIEKGRLAWEDSKEDIQRLEIGNYRALVMHGDEIGRNGYASPQTILRHVDRWKSGSYRVGGVKWPFRDVYVHHYHQLMEMTTADGEGRVFFNGSTESDNRYAMEQMAAAGLPTQRLHFIDPDRGLVVQRLDILLED